VRRRFRPAADPEAAALAVLDRYRGMLQALRDAGDIHAPQRLRVLWHARRDIEQWGMDTISRLRLQGYERAIEELTRSEPLPLRPAQHWANGPPFRCAAPGRARCLLCHVTPLLGTALHCSTQHRL
jgi:hypothetical protein